MMYLLQRITCIRWGRDLCSKCISGTRCILNQKLIVGGHLNKQKNCYLRNQASKSEPYHQGAFHQHRLLFVVLFVIFSETCAVKKSHSRLFVFFEVGGHSRNLNMVVGNIAQMLF